MSEKESILSCYVCGELATIEEVFEMANSMIDSTLCEPHKKELNEYMKG